MSDSPGRVDFAIGLVIFVLNLPDGQVLVFFWKFKLQKDCNQSCQSKRILGLVEMTCGLVHASYSLPEWQAVKLTFFAPWFCQRCMKINRARIIITVYLTIIPQVHVGYELAIIISYPTSVVVLLKTPSKYWEFFPTLFVRTTDFQLSADAYSYHIFIIWRAGIVAHMPWWLRQSEL